METTTKKDLKDFRLETRQWLEEHCPKSMRTPLKDSSDYYWGGRNPTFSSEDKKIWLLEINDNPHPTSSDDRLFKPFTSYAKDMIKDMLDELIYPMKNNTDVKPNNFELVHEKELLFNKWIFV